MAFRIMTFEALSCAHPPPILILSICCAETEGEGGSVDKAACPLRKLAYFCPFKNVPAISDRQRSSMSKPVHS